MKFKAKRDDIMHEKNATWLDTGYFYFEANYSFSLDELSRFEQQLYQVYYKQKELKF